MRRLIFSISILTLTAFFVPQALAGKYDGSWSGVGSIICPSLGINHVFPTDISIEKSKFEGRGENEHVIYSTTGRIDRLGKVRGGKIRISAPRIGSLDFPLSGKFEGHGAVVKYENNFRDGKIQVGEHTCLGEMVLTEKDYKTNALVNGNNNPVSSKYVYCLSPDSKSVQRYIEFCPDGLKNTTKNEYEKYPDKDSEIPPVVSSIETKLEKLKRLLDKGLITAEEAKSKRAQILDDL